MKNTLAALLILACLPAHAFAPDNACFARLSLPNGKVHKISVERKAYVQIAKVLNLGFTADLFDGQNPTTAVFVIQDAHDKSKREILTSTIVRDWSWHFERETAYGHLTVDCE